MTTAQQKAAAKQKSAFLKIAKNYIDIDTLDEQKMDDLDFHDISAISLNKMMQDAYALGYTASVEHKK